MRSSGPLVHTNRIMPKHREMLTTRLEFAWLIMDRLVVNSRDEIGLTSLHRASIKGPPAIIRMLSRAGAHLESTFEGLTSLHMACGRGHEDTVCALLQEGADRDARTAQGFTALHCASGRGGLGSVKVLLRAGADANVQSGGRQKRCPLHAAAVLGDKAVTEELLRWGASVDVPDSEGVTSLHIASAVDNAEVVRCLIGGGASTEVMQAGTLNTPLHLAAFQGSQSALVALLEAGANLSMRNVNGESPLHHACMMMDLAVVETLLRCGADEKARNNDDNTPTQVLGRGLHDQEEGTRGNSHVRAYISTMLARAPIERAWRRRSWLVVMRSRHFYWSHQEGNTGDSYISAVTVSGVPGAVYDREECFGQGDVGVEEESVVGAAFHRLISCVGWIVRVQEEGIFRNVASFL